MENSATALPLFEQAIKTRWLQAVNNQTFLAIEEKLTVRLCSRDNDTT
jgi:hypothetical protein